MALLVSLTRLLRDRPAARARRRAHDASAAAFASASAAKVWPFV